MMLSILGTKKLEYRGQQFHEHCFTCFECSQPIGTRSFIPKEQKSYCVPCYEKRFATKCTRCAEVGIPGYNNKLLLLDDNTNLLKCLILKIGHCPRWCHIPKSTMVYSSRLFVFKSFSYFLFRHRECFTCTNCKISLAGQRFTSRDDHPYCADCFARLFAKKCFACSKPITGKNVKAKIFDIDCS